MPHTDREEASIRAVLEHDGNRMEHDLRVFVYGTLRRGESNYHWMKGTRWLGRHVTEPGFTMLHLGGYPGVVPGGRSAITGEVFALKKRDLLRLDRLEDFPRLYRREEIDTPFGSAWMYLMVQPPRYPRVIGHGDWCRRRN